MPTAPGSQAQPLDLQRLWRNRPFRSFWLANLMSNLGTSAFVMAMTWLTVKTYGAHGIALLALGYGIPQCLLQVFGGATTDRVPRRLLFLRTQSALLLVASLLLLATTRGMVPLWLLVGVNACNGVISAFDTPARTALISEMVEREELVVAQQVYSVASNVTNVFGPALGGVLLSIGSGDRSHEELAFLFNVLSFLPLLACIPWLPRTPAPGGSASRPALWRSIREGLSYVRRQRPLRLLLQLLALVMLLGLPFQTLLPIFVHDHASMASNHSTYAALLSAVGLGGVVGSLLGMASGQARRLGLTLGAAAAGLGVAVLLLAGSQVIHWASLSAFLAGACGVFSLNLNNALMEGLTPMELQGRVIAIANLGKGLQAFSAAGASEAIHLLGRAMASSNAYLLVQSALAVALLVGVLLLWPALAGLEPRAQQADA
ncbi:MAG: MFS transporter [Synechococcaceae bacterium WBB_10_009]|nr:MFS transporter [Synechococcaceae bacterium WBB_10_009]